MNEDTPDLPATQEPIAPTQILGGQWRWCWYAFTPDGKFVTGDSKSLEAARVEVHKVERGKT